MKVQEPSLSSVRGPTCDTIPALLNISPALSLYSTHRAYNLVRTAVYIQGCSAQEMVLSRDNHVISKDLFEIKVKKTLGPRYQIYSGV